MDDRFLSEQRRDPDPAFASKLRTKLRAIEQDETPRRAWHALPMLAAAAGLVLLVGLFAFPSWRVQAQAMLDLFRVRDFAIVQVNEARLRDLHDRKFDPSTLFVADGAHANEHAPTQVFTSLDAAAAAAGFTPAKPELLPRGLAPDTVVVQPGSSGSARVDTRALRELMDTFDVRDLTVPAELEGHAFTVDMPTMVGQRFRSGGSARAMLMQCASPEVTLPKGVDMARLGEIGLRLIGVSRDEAHRLAGTIDWRSTLVVPVLASATSFQPVTVNGERGVIVETKGAAAAGGSEKDHGSVVLWSHAGRVYGLASNLDRVQLMEMAESVR